MSLDLEHAADVAVRLARAAGDAALGFRGRLGAGEVRYKGPRDLVTAADLEAERIVAEGLRATFPDHAVVAEEEVSSASAVRHGAGDEDDPATRPAGGPSDLSTVRERIASGAPCWIVDPLDGTTNFAHSHPFFAVSIALWADGLPRAAVVHAPALGETFTAVRGGGAFLGEERLRVSPCERLGDAIFATGFPYRRQELSPLENNVGPMNAFLLEVRGFRRCGSAAIDLAYVAAGRYAFFFEAQLEPWDVAAGGLLVEEAGGRVSDYDGGDDWLCGRRVVASNGVLHDVVRSRLRPS